MSGLVTRSSRGKFQFVTSRVHAVPLPWPGLLVTSNGQWIHFSRSVFRHVKKDTVDRLTQRFTFQGCELDSGHLDEKQRKLWRIGLGGIQRSDIIIIGAIHVSAGSWMPIMQLNHYIL